MVNIPTINLEIPIITPERCPPASSLMLVRFMRHRRMEVGVLGGVGADGLVDILQPMNSKTGRMELGRGALRRLEKVEILPL